MTGAERPTAATGVLESFLAQAVADDYADVPVAEGSGRRPHVLAAIATVLIGLIVVVAVLSTRGSDDTRQQTKQSLQERIVALSGEVDVLQAQVDERTKAVADLQSGILDQPGLGDVAIQADSLAGAAASAPVSGPGITVELRDAPDAAADSLNRVLDRDLQDVVNSLWQMGATGVAVNGHRLTGLTAIRSAGGAILVDYQPITPPYQVTAVGVTSWDADASPLGRILQLLTDDYGLVTSVTTGDVALPAGDIRSPRSATVDSPPGGPQ